MGFSVSKDDRQANSHQPRRGTVRTRVLAAAAMSLLAAGATAMGPAPSSAAPATSVRPATSCGEISKHPTISRGSTGKAVKHAQCLLRIGWGQSQIKSDGVFGAKTEEVVRRVQRACKGYTVDGIVGSKTWHALHYGCVPR